MRLPLFAGNWKMHGNVQESRDLANGIQRQLEDLDGREVVLCPPHPYLHTVQSALADSKILMGAQNCAWEAKGAYTGEVSPLMVKEAGCQYVILGHSERRHVMGESNDQINKKVRACFEHGLTPILCVGELLEERSMGDALPVVERQLVKGLENVEAGDASGMVLAYEPVWAIGTGKTATPYQAAEMHLFIRKFLRQKYGEAVANNIRILYGGSVKPDNIETLMLQENIDGALVGGASLQVHSFVQIAKVAL
ncbi:MAG: triose-phosphate isomerase [Planctomycetota bacterium]|nr:triose-phosphate isomerase [Planctomycetota bacterium]